jgi:cytochrome b subunit of formate dehydrogenase
MLEKRAQAIPAVSKQTRNNWLIFSGLFVSSIVAILSGIYFLFIPGGGFQGGRNPWYDVQILFDRHTWDDLHTWSGIVMIAVAVIHFLIHWSWVTNMARNVIKGLTGRARPMNGRGRWNLILNLIVALSFVLTAASGIYFLFVPGGRWAFDPLILFPRATWDLIHTWAGIVFITAIIIHFSIHWKWVSKVTRKMLGWAKPSSTVQRPSSANLS